MIFQEQVSRKPDHYPWAGEFIEAMHNGFWTDKEFSFTSDLQDFNVVLNEQEKDQLSSSVDAVKKTNMTLTKMSLF